MELDIYIPSCNIAIEYDGLNWHKSKLNTDRDNRKNRLCIDNGIKLIRVREIGLEPLNDCVLFYRNDLQDNNSLQLVVIDVLKYLGVNNISVDLDNNISEIMNMFMINKDENSIVSKFPEIAKEWHPTKNGDLKPENFNYGSQRKVWWKCSKNHEWQAVIGSRCKISGYGRGCPYCSGKILLKGFNDFKTWCIENKQEYLLKEWNYEKNNQLMPEDFGKGADIKIWWKCSKNHEWYATIGSRVSMHSGCPICAKQSHYKPVQCIETGIIYESVRLAEKQTKISTIRNCCNGVQKMAGGYHWKYLKNES